MHEITNPSKLVCPQSAFKSMPFADSSLFDLPFYRWIFFDLFFFQQMSLGTLFLSNFTRFPEITPDFNKWPRYQMMTLLCEYYLITVIYFASHISFPIPILCSFFPLNTMFVLTNGWKEIETWWWCKENMTTVI